MAERNCVGCGKPLTLDEYRRRGPKHFCCFDCRPLGRLARRRDDGTTTSRITCEWCGIKLIGRQRRVCCTEHGELVRGQRAVKTTRVCPVDGVEFEASNNKRYCSERCAKRSERAAARGQALTVDELPLPGPFNCAYCGCHCVPSGNVAPHATRFCGKDCKAGWHKENVEVPRLLLASITAEATPHQCVGYREAMRHDPCAYCDAPAEQLDHIVARSRGGSDDWSNRAGTCARCNGRKQNLPLLIWMGWKVHNDELVPWAVARRELLAA